jgi:flagellar biosynthesis chaperone FliJ
MEITGETFRGLSREYGYSEDALARHKANHLTIDLSEVKAAKEEARAEALEKVKAEELKDVKDEVQEGTAARLENAANFLDQLREIRNRAANLLDQAEASQNMRAAGTFLRELREQIRLMAELEGKISSQPTVNILVNPEWIQLRTVIIQALDPFPQAKEAVVNAIRGR